MAEFTYRILVVDDEPRVREASEAVLTRRGFEVRTAADGFEALALMRKALPDMLISDLKMPNMSGFEFLSVVRRRFPHIPVIAITGEFHGAETPEGLLADAFFHKGEYAPETLFERIASLLAECPIRPHLAKPDKAPVWLPRHSNYVVLTCTECRAHFRCPSMRRKKAWRRSHASTAERCCDTSWRGSWIQFEPGPWRRFSNRSLRPSFWE